MKGVERRERGRPSLGNIQTREDIGTRWFFPPVLILKHLVPVCFITLCHGERNSSGTGSWHDPVLMSAP